MVLFLTQKNMAVEYCTFMEAYRANLGQKQRNPWIQIFFGFSEVTRLENSPFANWNVRNIMLFENTWS